MRSTIAAKLFATALALCALAPFSARAADKIIVGAVSIGTAIQWPLWVMVDKGFAAEEDLTVDLVAIGSANNVLQQAAAGSLNLAIPVAGDAFRAIDKGAQITVVRTDCEHVPHTLVVKPSIKTMTDLKGKVISIGALVGLDRIYLDNALAAAGLHSGEYDVIAAGSTSHRFSALMSGAVDAATIAAPLNFRAVGRGFNDLGSVELKDHHYPFSLYVAYTPWLQQHGPLVVRYLRAYAKAVNWLNDAKNKEEASAILAKWGRGRVEDARMTYDLFHKGQYFLPRGDMTPADLDGFIDLLAKAGYIKGSHDPRRFFDSSYLAAAMKAR